MSQAPTQASHAGQRFSLYHTEGREDSLRQWMAPYADMFAGRGRVLDVGCGPGLFLDLLRERGVEAHGIDLDADMVARCRARGHSADVGDARDRAGLGGPWGGIHLGHVVEHMDGPAAVALLEACAGALEPGGLLVVRTPNWANDQVRGGGFWLDHTHVRPYPLELLERVLADIGMVVGERGHEPTGWQDIFVAARKPEAVRPAATDALGEVREAVAAGRFDEAVCVAAHAAAAAPAQDGPWLLLALSLRLSGRLVDAADAVERALTVRESPEALMELLRVSLAAGGVDAASMALEAIEARYPDWAEAARGEVAATAAAPR
ncbi:MAG: class I SAM-dependent methyltransferase [Chthonomonadales bacterium]|nr:class I SAM-dependent methyltransferase [Chthonomonadales bacterium]